MLREKCNENIRILWPAEKVVLLSYVNIGDGLNEEAIYKDYISMEKWTNICYNRN